MPEDKTALECHPPPTPPWQWPVMIFVTVAILGGLIFICLLMVVDPVTHYQTTQQDKLVLFAVSGVLSVVLLGLFVRWNQDRWYWVLEKDRLIGGKRRDRIYPFSSIATIVPGLPGTTNVVVAANKIVDPGLWESVVTERKLALLLKFSDGSFMPFHVHRCVNGTQLMTELVKRLADRLDRDYEYTQPEIKALRSADWNRIVKPKLG